MARRRSRAEPAPNGAATPSKTPATTKLGAASGSQTRWFLPAPPIQLPSSWIEPVDPDQVGVVVQHHRLQPAAALAQVVPEAGIALDAAGQPRFGQARPNHVI